MFRFAIAFLLFTSAAAAQTIDPTQRYRTVETANFRITFTPELEPLVAHAARSAENAYAMLQQQVGPAPGGRIDLLLSDASDITNGFATPLPSNRITVFVNPPVESLELQNFRDWLDLVITHELAHTFHLETTGTLGRFARGIFGRLPYSWPVFPAASTPRWAREGLAVEIESLDGVGRVHGSYHDMVVRTAILEDAFDPIDRVSHDSPRWPDGQRAYIYGSLFLDYITRTHGLDARRNIVSETGGSILPPELAMNRIAKKATGRTFSQLWDEWHNDLRQRTAALADSLRGLGLTRTETIAGRGRIARYPRVSRDGRFLSFAEESGSDVAHTRVIDLGNNNAPAWAQRRTGIAPSSWIPDQHALLTAQVEFAGRYRLYSDVYSHAERGETRLTTGTRIQDPDIDNAGSRMVAVQNEAGNTRLVLLSRSGDSLRALTAYQHGTQWSMPRWSPDGSRIAVTRWQNGSHDIVLVDTTGIVLPLTADPAIDGTPAWSPDGRFVLFRSDRTGIPNLFAADVASAADLKSAAGLKPPNETPGRARIFQVTSVLTGAFDPDVSPDARHIYFVAYHADGFRIERMPYDTMAWRLLSAPAPMATRAASHDTEDRAFSLSEPRPYAPRQTMRPYYWLPVAYRVGFAGTFIGVSTSGRDLLGRHAYAAALAVDPSNRRTAGSIDYGYTRFDNPSLGLSLRRDWDDLGRFRVVTSQADTSIVNAIEREDVALATAQFARRRVRSITAVSIGAELVHRSRLVADSGHIRFREPNDRLWGPVARFSFANTRAPAHAISTEDGLALQLSARLREDFNRDSDRGYAEVTTWNTAYKAFDAGAFAHHVVAVRFSGLLRDGNGATLSSIGGAPGSRLDLGPASIGTSGGLLPVRGFEPGDRFGTRAWTASIEYRVPLAFPARGHGLWPVFIDRLSAAAFADAGNASCPPDVRRVFSCPPPGAGPLAAAGTEFIADLAIGFVPPLRTRFGVAWPFSRPDFGTKWHLSLGSSF